MNSMANANLIRVKEFLKKYKAPLVLSILTVLIFTAFIFKDMVTIASVAVVAMMVLCSLEEQICLIMYLAVFSGRSPIYIVSVLFCFVTLAVRYVIEAIKKEKPVYKKQLILTALIVVVFTIVHHSVSTEGFYNWAMFVCLIWFAYFAVIYHNEINLHKAFKTLILAIFVSAALGVVGYFTGLVKEVYYYDDVVHRLRLFTLNVNHLAMFSAFSIAYIISLVIKKDFSSGDFKFLKDKHFWFRMFYLAALVVVGLLTMSKAFLLVVLFMAIYALVFVVLKYRVKSLWFVLVVCLCGGLVCLVAYDYVSAVLNRFVAYDSWNGLLSKITTGRSEIWVMYLKEFANSVWNILFGVGLLTTDLISKGPHNVFIYLIYRVGIVGLLMIGVLIYFYIRQAKGKFKFSFGGLLLLLVYMFFALEEMVLSDRFFLFLIFGIMMLLKNDEPLTEQENYTKIDKKFSEEDKNTHKTDNNFKNIS